MTQVECTRLKFQKNNGFNSVGIAIATVQLNLTCVQLADSTTMSYTLKSNVILRHFFFSKIKHCHLHMIA